jgi:hypothetical protein
MQEHLGKYRKLVPALALVTHLVDIASNQAPKGSSISAKSLERALRWVRYLETHARRIYGMGTNVRIKAAQALAKRIQAGTVVDGFSERDVYIKGWAMLKDPDAAQDACRELEAANWIRRLPPPPRASGRPPAHRYRINPAAIETKNARSAPTKLAQLKK